MTKLYLTEQPIFFSKTYANNLLLFREMVNTTNNESIILLSNNKEAQLFVTLLGIISNKRVIIIDSKDTETEFIIELAQNRNSIIISSEKHTLLNYLDRIKSLSKTELMIQLIVSNGNINFYIVGHELKKEVQSINGSLSKLSVLLNEIGDNFSLSFYSNGIKMLFDKESILSQINIIKSQFLEKDSIFNFEHISFKEGFAYMLTAILFNRVVELTNSDKDWNNFTIEHNIPKTVFIGSNELKQIYKKSLKYKIKDLLLFQKLKNTLIIRKEFNIKHKDELVLFYTDTNYNLTKLFSNTKTKVSFALPLLLVGNTLAFNRYFDKSCSILKNEFRISHNQRMFVDDLNRVYIIDSSISKAYDGELCEFSKSKNDLLYKTNYYGKIKKDIFSIIGNEKSIYYNKDTKSVIGLNSITNVIEGLPFVSKSFTLLTKKGIVIFINIDFEAVNILFKEQNLSTLVPVLNRIKEEINSKESFVKVYKILASVDLFKSFDSISHYVNEESIVKYLSHKAALL